MPARAFFVSPFGLNVGSASGAATGESQCPRAHSLFLHPGGLRLVFWLPFERPCESQCPRGHSSFLHLPTGASEPSAHRLRVSMPARAFFVSPPQYPSIFEIINSI